MAQPATPPSRNGVLADSAPLSPVKSPPDDVSSYPLAAQIPVKDFNLPTFPKEASRLRELTLTSDIKLDEYQNLLQSKEYELPEPPQSITHLTLELFSLGFPGLNPRYLSNLSRALPNLKSITFFSTLIDGLTNHSRNDAEDFFRLAPNIAETHLIDSFVRPGFFTTLGKQWDQIADEAQDLPPPERSGAKVVEVSYTFRGHDHDDFLAKIHGTEIPSLLVRGLVGFGAGFVEARDGEMQDELDRESGVKSGAASGVLPFANDSRASVALKKRFEMMSGGELKELRVLNLSMWTLTAEEVAQVLYGCAKGVEGGDGGGLIDLTISVLMEEGWVQALVEGVGGSGAAKTLEGIEVVGVPAKAKEEGEDWKSGEGLIDDKSKVEELGKACAKLGRLEMSILKARKAGGVQWLRERGGHWQLNKE